MDPAVYKEFILESTHSLESVEKDLLILEKQHDPAVLSRVFRSLHSIKGAASFLELKTIETLGHRIETLLDLLRQQKRTLTPASVDALLKTIDQLAKLIKRPDFGADVDVSEACAILTPFIEGGHDSQTPTPHAAHKSLAPITIAQAPPSPTAQPLPTVSTAQRLAELVPTPAPVQLAPPAPLKPLIDSGDDTMMRVRVKFLDDLLQLTGNMVMARNQLLSHFDFTGDPAFTTLSQCVTEVHKTVVQTRMLPIGTLFDRGERQVRDLARQLGKEVQLEIRGRDLELDRSVLDAFADPLNHLLRNALDHGIESPSERIASGKTPEGKLVLTATRQGGEIILSVEDDGQGIDPDRVRESAIRKGILSPEQAAKLSRRETIDLLFHPGFSTRTEVTNLSGRGVGLDVVRTNLERLGGVVDVQSTPWKGSLFAVRLPLTTALVASSLIAALVVKCGPDRFAIPQTSVDEIIKVRSETERRSLTTINGRTVYQLRDLVLPIVRLDDIIRDRPATPLLEPSACPPILIVMRFRELLFGILVDSIVGFEEIVVRPLPSLVKNSKIFSGHTVMGDGHVALILDAPGLIENRKLSFAGESDLSTQFGNTGTLPVDGVQRLVVFNFAPEEYFAIPLEMVSLIETIRTNEIRRVGAKEYIHITQRTLPLMQLDKVMGVGSIGKVDRAHVLIPARVSYPIALMAGNYIRVVDILRDYESRLSDDKGMLGTFLHEGKLVMLLDLYRLYERHSPDQFISSPVEKQPAHLLLAEDSPFFQNLIRSYLQHPPRNLTIVGDGREALDLLRSRPGDFDILISDIEMPRMDGFHLIREVRSDPILRDIPAIAVTSLASTENVERGIREGFDAYLIKIDKEQLLQTIERNLERGRKRRAAANDSSGRK